MSTPPEYNVTGIDYAERRHLRYARPDHRFSRPRHGHAPRRSAERPAHRHGPGASIEQAATMLDVGAEFGIRQTVTMCPVDDIQPFASASAISSFSTR